MDVTKIPIISNLPPELIFYILSFLSLKDLSRAGNVNKQFHTIVQDCRRILSGAGKGDTWREQYLWLSTQREKQKEAFVLMNQLLFKESVALLNQYDLGNDLALMLKDALNGKQVSLRAAGEFLTSKDYSHVIDGFLDYFDFSKMELSEALRKLLVSIKLPNTQSIGPIMEKFAKKYLRQHPECSDLFTSASTVSNLSFSIYLICNTEEGFPRQIPLPQKKFIDNNRGINDGKDLPLHYLETTYDRVIHTNSPLSENSTKFPEIASTDFWHILKSGWMYKQGMDLLRMWKRRWFVLTSDGNLYYYRKPTETPLGVIKVSEIVVSRLGGKKPGLKFMNTTKSIQTSMREHYYVTMDTEEEASQWMEAIISHPEYSEKKHKSATSASNTPPETPRKAASAPASRVPSKIEELTEETPYFGFPLEKILEREGTVVPLLVQTAIDDLVATALDEEGILRLSGSMVEMAEIRSEIEHGKIDFTKRDPHAVAGLLKSFFRELPEPIITREYNTAITAMLGYGSGPDVVEEIRNVLRSLPTPNYELWKIIVAFLLHVDAHSDKNKMPVANLLRVMTPTLNCAPGLISMSMEQYSYFFDDVMEEPEEVKKEDDLFDDISKSFQNILEQEKRENEQAPVMESVRRKKNRRHRKSMEISPSDVPTTSEAAEGIVETSEPETPRSRRRNKQVEENAAEDSPSLEKKEKKKKKEKTKSEATLEIGEEEHHEDSPSVEKKKKKKKEKKEFSMDASMDSVISVDGEKKKPRKKKTESAVSSPRLSLELDNPPEIGSETPPREKSKKSRKKKPVGTVPENDTKIIIEVEGTEITI